MALRKRGASSLAEQCTTLGEQKVRSAYSNAGTHQEHDRGTERVRKSWNLARHSVEGLLSALREVIG